MVEPITAVYVEENGDWAVSVAGQGKKLTGRAPGIIAARDRVDQLVEKLARADKPTVVHLLNGSALAFTSAYMTARLTRSEPVALEIPPAKTAVKKTTRAKAASKPTPTARKPRPRAVPDIADEETTSIEASGTVKKAATKTAVAKAKKVVDVDDESHPQAASA